MIGNSKCCDAKITFGLCFNCGEKAEPIKYNCEICEDTGEVSTDEMDRDGNLQRGVGTEKCECKYEDVDFSNPIDVED